MLNRGYPRMNPKALRELPKRFTHRFPPPGGPPFSNPDDHLVIENFPKTLLDDGS